MNASELILKDEVYRIVGSAIAVLRDIGHGLHEMPYENALTVEFASQPIGFIQQQRLPILYRNTQVGEYVPDLIAFGVVVVDTKIIDRFTDPERGQMMNYLRITRLRVGVILNFKRAKLEWERIVLSDHSR